MNAVPMEFKEASAFVDRLHRHHAPVARDKFRVAVEEDGVIHGVVQVGNPVARRLADGKTLEVVRCCTDGYPNACSFLYSRAARIAKEMGYKKIITYILNSEDGASLKASGWQLEAENVGGVSWNVPSRPRNQYTQLSMFNDKTEKYPAIKKQRWCKYL